MNAYIYQAALYCAPCGEAIRTRLASDLGIVWVESGDSDSFPQGPYAGGGGEADSPQHCDACGVHLENPLTRDGETYVREAVAKYVPRPGDKWRTFYSYLWD